MRPFCPTCCRWMTCEKNDVIVAELSEPVATVRNGDVYACDGCGSRVVTGFGASYMLFTEAAKARADLVVRGVA